MADQGHDEPELGHQPQVVAQLEGKSEGAAGAEDVEDAVDAIEQEDVEELGADDELVPLAEAEPEQDGEGDVDPDEAPAG